MLPKDQTCPDCGGRVDRIIEPEPFRLGDVTIVAMSDFFRCTACGCEFTNDRINLDPLPAVYQEYERITGRKWKGTGNLAASES
jgi:hypothetical protein